MFFALGLGFLDVFFCGGFFYGFDPMGFIAILQHHLGNMFVIFFQPH